MGKRNHKPVFFDGGKRWRKIKKSIIALFMLVILVVSGLTYSFVSHPSNEIAKADSKTLYEKVEEINNEGRLVINQGTFVEIKDVYGKSYVRRYGENQKVVSLTFDDGPDPSITPKILEILDNENVKATFYLLGSQMYKYPEIGHQVLAQGSDLGLHTFTHSENKEDKVLTERQIATELDFTTKLFSQLYGYETKLFRVPYLGTEDILSYNSLQLLREAQERNFVTSAPTVDSYDYRETDPDKIFDNATKVNGQTAVILFHDAGGDRSGVVEALPTIIRYYKNEGYKFVTISELAQSYNLPIREELTTGDKITAFLVYYTYKFYTSAPTYLSEGFALGFATVLLHVTAFVVMALVYIVRRRRFKANSTRSYVNENSPFVSIIVPMFNEERGIRGTIKSILNSSYKNFELIIVDDGSNDKSFEYANKFAKDPRVTILTKANGGKVSALNLGADHAKGDINIFIDADTRIVNGSIKKLVAHFEDKKVAAVAGNVKIGNIKNLLTRLQALEYIFMQAIEKRSFDLFDKVLVVPGAFGGWRNSVLRRHNGFSSSTHAEDFDLTMKLLKNKHKVKFAEDAIAYTEAPSSLKQLYDQRLRWNFGNLQVYSKYRSMIFDRKHGILGLVFIPRAVFFQIFSNILAPFVDLFIIYNILFGQRELTLLFVSFYLLLQMIVYAIAVRSMKYPISSVLLVPFLRFFYSPFLYAVFYASLFQAMKGDSVAWVKLQHFGKFYLIKNN